MKKLFKNEAGNILAFTAAGLMALMGFAGLAIDMGCILTARYQLQNAVDAAALAGASGLLTSTSTATNRAIYFAGRNDCLNQSVQISTANVTYPSSGRVRVQATRNVQLFFSPVIGISQATITVDATAELGSLGSTKGLRPWGMPKSGWNVGDQVIIKPGDNKESPSSSFFNCVCFPPVNQGNPQQGASNYRANIRNGTDYSVSIGDVLEVEPGNMTGPTSQGVNDLIDADPSAYWDGHQVSGSSYSGGTSPRVVKIPLYDAANPPKNGRSELTVVGLAAFFIEGMNGGDVIGRFIKTVTTGAYGGGYSLLYKVKMTE